MSRGNVLIAAPVHQVLTEGLESLGYSLVRRENIVQHEAPGLLAESEGVVTSTRLKLNSELLGHAGKLKWVGRMGSGMEIIDVDFAKKKGITLISSPEGNRNAVGEHTVGLLLAVMRRIAWSYNEVRQDKWLREENRGTELEGQTIGIVGFGNTGRALAQKLQGFGMHILTYDKYNNDPVPEWCQQCNDLSAIKEAATIVSFHVPLQEDTQHYVDESFVSEMEQPFILLNTSRGEIVDAAAILKGMNEGKIIGFGADVWEEEPLHMMGSEQKQLLESLLTMPQTVVTPHIAGYTKEALYKMSVTLLKKITVLAAN